MVIESAALHSKTFTKFVNMVPIREGFGSGLVIAGKENENVVALCADLTESTKMHHFRKAFPNRFVEVGIGEQSMASVASGMAAMGKIPFFSSYAMFSPGRNWEQIRTTICYNNVNAKIVGSHAGISVGPDGATHQAIEDIAITRVIPRMTIIVPCDSTQAQKATITVAKHIGPTYLRLQRSSTAQFTTEQTPFEIGKVYCYYRSSNPKVTLYSCGAVLHTVLMVAQQLEEVGVGSIVINVPTIKPLDGAVVSYAKETECVVTVEEHQRIGGLGSAIAEILSEQAPMPVHRIGINDAFGQSGEPEVLLQHYGLDAEHIFTVVKDAVEKK